MEIGILEKSIKTREDIKSFNIKRVFEDDHLICVELEINDVDIEFLYFDDIGFLYNWEFLDRSFKVLLESIESYYDGVFER
jgi:hypothetical protein